jgi:hypothetical protein
MEKNLHLHSPEAAMNKQGKSTVQDNMEVTRKESHCWFDTSFKLRPTRRHVGAPRQSGWSLKVLDSSLVQG